MPTSWKKRVKFLFTQCKPHALSPADSVPYLDFSGDKSCLVTKPEKTAVSGDRPSAMLKWAIGSKNSGESSSRTSFSDLKKASARFLRRRDSKSSKGRSPSSHSNNTSTTSTSPALPPKSAAVTTPSPAWPSNNVEASPPLPPRQLITASCSSSSMSLNSGEGVVREATVRKVTTLRQSQELRPKEAKESTKPSIQPHDASFLTKLKSRLDTNRHSRRHARKKRTPAVVHKSIYSLQDLLSNDNDSSSLYMRLEHIPVAVRSRRVLQDISNNANALPPGYQQMIADLHQEMTQFTDDETQDGLTTTLAEVDISQYSYSSKQMGDFEEIADLQQMLGEIRLQQQQMTQPSGTEDVQANHQRSSSQCSYLASFTNLPPVDLHKPLPVKPPSPANASQNQTPEPVALSPVDGALTSPKSFQDKSDGSERKPQDDGVTNPAAVPASASCSKTVVPAVMGHRGEFSSLHSVSGESRPLPPLGFHFNASPVKKTCHTSTGQHVHINYDSRPLKSSSSVLHLRPPPPPTNSANKKTARSSAKNTPCLSEQRLPVVFETDQEDNVSVATKVTSTVPSPIGESGTSDDKAQSTFLNVPCNRRGLCSLEELELELPAEQAKEAAVCSTNISDSHTPSFPATDHNSNHEKKEPVEDENRKSPEGHDWQPSYVNLEDTEIAPVLLASSRPADESMDFWKPRTVENDELNQRSHSGSPVYDSPNRQPAIWPSVHRYQHGDANSLANSSSSDTQDSGVAEMAMPGRTLSPSVSASPVLVKSLFHPALPGGHVEEEEDAALYEEMRAIIGQPQSYTLPRTQKSANNSRSLSSCRFQAIQPADNVYPDWYLDDVTVTPALRQSAFCSLNSSVADRDILSRPTAKTAAVPVLCPSYENVYLASAHSNPMLNQSNPTLNHRRYSSYRNSGDFEPAPLTRSSDSAFSAVRTESNKNLSLSREHTKGKLPEWPSTANSSLRRSSSSSRRSSSLQERELRLQRMLEDSTPLPEDTYGDMSDWSMEAMLSDTIRDCDSVSNAAPEEDNNGNGLTLGLEPLVINGHDTDPSHQHHAHCGCVRIPLQPFLFIDNHTLAQWQAQYNNNNNAIMTGTGTATAWQTKETQTEKRCQPIHEKDASSSTMISPYDYLSDGCETWNSHMAQYLRTPKLSRNHILGRNQQQASLCFTPPKKTRSSRKSLAPPSGRMWKHTRHHVSTPTKSGRLSRDRLSYSNLTSRDSFNVSRTSRRSRTARHSKAARLNCSWKSNSTWRTCHSVASRSALPRRTVKRRKAAEVLQGKGQLQLSVYLNSGLLTIHILAARKLRAASGSSCNTYVKLSLIPDNDERTFCRTNLIKGDNNPWFDQKFSFEFLSADLHKRLLVSVWNRDLRKNRSEFLGCMSFGVSHVIRKDVNGWYRLLNERVGRKRHFAVKNQAMDFDNQEGFNGFESQEDNYHMEMEDNGTLNVADGPSTKSPVTPDSTRSAGRTPYTITLTLQKESQGYGFSVAWTHPPRIERVEPGMAADKAGVKVGDYIIFVGSQNVVKMKEDQVLQHIQAAGQKLTLEIYRKSIVTPARSSASEESMAFFTGVSPASNSAMTSLLPGSTSAQAEQPLHSHATVYDNKGETAVDDDPTSERKQLVHGIINEEQKFVLTLAQMISSNELAPEVREILKKMEKLSEDIVTALMAPKEIGSNLGIVYSEKLEDLISAYTTYLSLNPSSPVHAYLCDTEFRPSEPLQHLSKQHRMFEKLRSREEQDVGDLLQSVSQAFSGVLELQRGIINNVPAAYCSPVREPSDPILSLEKRLLLGVFTNKIRPRLATPGRQWLYHGELWKVKGRQSRRFWALLFTDMLLLTRVSTTKVVFLEEEPIFLDHAQLRENASLGYAFDLLWKPRDKGIQSVTFKAPRLVEKQNWISKIAALLEEISIADVPKVAPNDPSHSESLKSVSGPFRNDYQPPQPPTSLKAKFKQRFFSSSDQLHAPASTLSLKEDYYDGFNPRASLSYQHYHSGDDYLDSAWESFDSAMPCPPPSLTDPFAPPFPTASVGRFHVTSRSTPHIAHLPSDVSSSPSPHRGARPVPDVADGEIYSDSIAAGLPANEDPVTFDLVHNPVISQSGAPCVDLRLGAPVAGLTEPGEKTHFRKNSPRPASSHFRSRSSLYQPRFNPWTPPPLPVLTNSFLGLNDRLDRERQFRTLGAVEAHTEVKGPRVAEPEAKLPVSGAVIYPKLDSTASTPCKVSRRRQRGLTRLLSAKTCPSGWPRFTLHRPLTFNWRTFLSGAWKRSSHRQDAPTKPAAASNAPTPTPSMPVTFNRPQKVPQPEPDGSSAFWQGRQEDITKGLDQVGDYEDTNRLEFNSKCAKLAPTHELALSPHSLPNPGCNASTETDQELAHNSTVNVDCPVSASGTTSRANLQPPTVATGPSTLTVKNVPPVFKRLRQFSRTPGFPKFFTMRQHAQGMTIEHPRNIGDSSESSPSWASAPSSAGIETPSDIDLAFDFGQRCDVQRRRTAPRNILGSLTTPETSDASPSPRPVSSGTVFRFPFVTTKTSKKRAVASRDEIKSLDLACSAADLFSKSSVAVALPTNSAAAAVATPSRLTRLLRRTNSATCTPEHPVDPPPYALFLRAKPKVSKAKSADIPCPESERNEEEAKWRRGL